MKKRLIKYLLIGYLAGILIGTVIAMAATGRDIKHLYSDTLLKLAGSPAAASILHAAFSGLIGAVSFGGMLLYNTDLSIAAATILHFVIIEAVYLPVALILGWLPFSLPDIGIMTGVMFTAFFIIWGIMYLRNKRSVRQLNELTQNKSKAKEQDIE